MIDLPNDDGKTLLEIVQNRTYAHAPKWRVEGDGLPLDVRIQTQRYAIFRLLRANAPHERLREEWSKLETLLDTPTRDGAEGVVEPVVRDTNMFSRRANEPPAVIPEGYSAPLDIRTAAEIEHDRGAQKSAPPKPAPDALRPSNNIADKAMHRIWKEWFKFYERHFRGPNIRVSMAEQMAFYEIAQPILRGLSLPVQPNLPLGKDTLYAILSKHIPSDMIDGIWQEINEAIEVKP